MINKFSSIPLYLQLKDLIIKKIEDNEFPANSQIPSEQDLCQMYDISRPTVRQAVSELTNSGYLYKEKGKGTFVYGRKNVIDIKNYSGFTDSILDCQTPAEKNIIDLKNMESSSVSHLNEIFNFNSSMSVAEITYLSFINNQRNEVYSLNKSYISLSLFPDIISQLKDGKSSIDILRGKYPLIPDKSRSILEIVFADQNDSPLLRVQPGQPLIKLQNTLFSKSGQPVEYIISKYRADNCRLLFENSK
ncbi:transcriptional regulator, GntR family [Ruminiclostridium papyrosolvens DSM 2782]|uniref:Transcriptional regulator, GntR family n=1 Tax=Ruminiclostridium papyrosolvens DSM 2782 TaxID=588581 RepID=F1TI98_9FIRM|nr:GntR family transcriptional regulator [Ruminiclostridium papyrosolvens]EGD45876.1 transcriptional regulator, GntR family [Ruminiclostridium papyrosolvens DSM 2782]WES36356.1 GntR family transcriptional regulator [Ruminiclostridium papyrosolvens DSM 2782]